MAEVLRLVNARIWTGDAGRPWRDSLTVVDGRVVEETDSTTTEPIVVDGRGRVAVPGFVDAHVHLLDGGLALSRLHLGGVRDRDEFEQAIAEAHATLPADRWLIAYGWSNERWSDRSLPDMSWLRVAGDRPVVCYRMDLHAALVNEPVLDRCDLETPLADGRVVRDERSGAPTGLMIEAAAWRLVNPIVPEPSHAERVEALRAAQVHAHRFGITTVGAMEYQRDLEAVFAAYRDELTLRCRITLLDRDWPLDVTPGARFAGDEHLAVVGYKAFADGTLGSRSARLLAPYADDPDNRGMLVELVAEGHLDAWARRVVEAGLSPAIHAIGDEAARLALDAVEPLATDACCRIEHAQQLDARDVRRFAGVVASMQPRHKADDGRYLEQRVGTDRLCGSFAFRSLLEAGATLSFGSDWPVVPCDPMEGIAAAVTGRTLDGNTLLPEQNLTVTETLTAFTAAAARSLGLEDAGTLRRGAFGDFVLLDRDPWDIDWASDRPKVVLTVSGGKIVYEEGTERLSD